MQDNTSFKDLWKFGSFMLLVTKATVAATIFMKQTDVIEQNNFYIYAY